MNASVSTSSRSNFSGLWVPLVTPFTTDAVDHAALGRLVEHLVSAGVSGFVVCGSTGEAAALSDKEQLAVLRTVGRHAGNLPLMMGVGGSDLAATLAWLQTVSAGAAQELPKLHSVLVSAPCYIRPAQAGLLHWFHTLADNSSVPLVVYDIPYRTGIALERDTLLALARHWNIQAIKDCGGDHAKTQALLRDGGLQVLAGEDLQFFSTLALGGVGAITASAHIHTERWVALMTALRTDDLSAARRLWQPLAPLVEALFSEPNPAPIKALLARQRLGNGELRPPMTAMSATGLERLVAVNARVAETMA
jgi:4-hydroxy-tetrahydrodipicolinate synthase